MQANDDEGKLEEYDPTANPVGDLPLFDGIDTKLEKLESKVESKESEKEIPTLADEKNDETKVVSASPLPYKQRKKKSLAQLAAEAQENSHEGKLVCPDCGCQDFRVTHTIPADGYRKRLRRCRHCGYPINTVEFVLRD